MAHLTGGGRTVAAFLPCPSCRHSFHAIPLPSCRWQQCAVPSQSAVTQESADWSSAIVATLPATTDHRDLCREVRTLFTLSKKKKKKKKAWHWNYLLFFSSSKFKRVTNPEINLRLQVTFCALSLSTKMGTTLFVGNFSLVSQQHAAKRSVNWLKY